MTARKVIVGLCMLCALLVSAVAAQGASAAGTTAYTCKAGAGEGPNKFSEDHCKTVDNATGTFGHFKIEKGTKTAITGSSGGTSVFLHSVQSGVEEELEATGVSGSGFMENKETAGGEMYAHGTGVITYTGVSVVKPSGKGCKVKGENVVTNELTATTEGSSTSLKFTPASGEVFASFEIEGCSTTVLNGLYEVKGSVTSSSISGATTNFDRTATTNLNTLKVRGQKAGLAGTLTIKGEGVPLSVT